jgi:hypothetical protein
VSHPFRVAAASRDRKPMRHLQPVNPWP